MLRLGLGSAVREEALLDRREKAAGTTARRMVLGGRLRTSSSTAALTVPSPTAKSTLPPLKKPVALYAALPPRLRPA